MPFCHLCGSFSLFLLWIGEINILVSWHFDNKVQLLPVADCLISDDGCDNSGGAGDSPAEPSGGHHLCGLTQRVSSVWPHCSDLWPALEPLHSVTPDGDKRLYRTGQLLWLAHLDFGILFFLNLQCILLWIQQRRVHHTIETLRRI